MDKRTSSFGELSRPREIPVKSGDELDVRIISTGQDGDGVAKVEGFVLFVPNAKEGEELRVRVTKVFARHAVAEAI